MRSILAIALALSLFVLGSKVLPQSPNGSIRGIVLDPDTKAIPAAEIIVVNDATAMQYQTKTNGEGIYNVENLPPGPYRIQVSKFGFKAMIKPDIILNVQDALLLNFTLEIGASSVVVTVEGGAPLINTTDASVSTVVDRQFAENLPMNGRSFQTLIDLAPGVVVVATKPADGGQFSVNGQRAESNYWMVDGVSANIGISAGYVPGNGMGGTLGSFNALGGTSSLVSVDAMQEFRIQTSSFSPEFGHTPGGQISIVTRSGTNQFHGTAFDFLRNNVFDANNWFANSVGLPKPEERQNDFGGTLGGPIAKDRSFFFFSYEGLRLRVPQTALTNVPDLAARQAAVPGMKVYLNAFPLSNGSDDPSTGIAKFNASYSNPSSLDAYSLRIDHKLNDKWSLFGRYNYSPSEFTVRGTLDEFAALNNLQRVQIDTQTATAGAVWRLSDVATNDFRFNYSRTSGDALNYLDNFGGAVPFTTLPFPNPYNAQNGFFDLFAYGMGVGGELGVGKYSKNLQRQLNFVDSFSWQEASHTIKFGIDVRRLTPIFDPAEYSQSPEFDTVADLSSGTIVFGEVTAQKGVTFLFRNFGAYAQDTWRATRFLTLTYGLRWEIDFAPSSLHGPNIPAVTGYTPPDFAQLALAPVGTPPYQTTYGNLAPRLGAAYQISHNQDWSTVLRGGFGVFYDLASSQTGNLLAQISANPPFGNSSFPSSTVFPFTPAEIVPPLIPPTASLSNLASFNPNLKLPYTLQWNLAVEQSVGKNQSVSVSYVAAAGRRLLQSIFLLNVPANPNVNGTFVGNTAASDFNALQVKFERRLTRGLQALASYSWSHSIDDASAGSAGVSSNLAVPGSSANSNRGDSIFDIRNSFNAGLTYEIPKPHLNKVTSLILGGWSVESLLLARSAPPVDLSDVRFYEIHGVYTNIRPDIVPGHPFYLYGPQFPGGKAFNPSTFTDPPTDPVTGIPTRQGDLGRDSLRGFGATQWDLAIHRDFPLRESVKLQFRAELFNCLNHPNFGPPNGQFGGASFGVSSQTLAQSLSSGAIGAGGFNALYQIGGPRSIQLALKLTF